LAGCRCATKLRSGHHGSAGADGREDGKELPRHIALEAADDLLLGLALGGAPGHVRLRPWIVPQARDDHRVERRVGLPITSGVEAVANPPSRGSLAGCDPPELAGR